MTSPSDLPYPPPRRNPGETNAQYERRYEQWRRDTDNGQHAPPNAPRPSEPTPPRREPGETTAEYDRRYEEWREETDGGRQAPPPESTGPTADRGDTGGTSSSGGTTRPTSPYSPPATPSYNSGDPFGGGITYDERGNAVGNVVWGVGPTNEPGYGDADKPTTATVEYDMRQAMEWLLDLSQSNPTEYADMVYQLWQAGYLQGDKEQLITGVFSMEVADAFNALYGEVDLINAGGNDISIFDYLGERIQGRIESGALGEDGNPVPPPRSYTDPETLKASVRAASEDVLGRRLTDEEADRFAAHFRGLEDNAYGLAEADSNYTAPDIGGQAEAFVEDGFSNEAAGQRAGSYVQSLQRMMGLG